MQGETGPTGLTGETGPTGLTGETGPTGPIGGSDTQVLYNNGGVASGDPALTFDVTTGTTTISSLRIVQTNATDVTAGLYLEAGFGTGSPTVSNYALVSFSTRGGGGGTVTQSLFSMFEGGNYGLSFKNGNAYDSPTFVRVDAAGSQMGVGTVSPAYTLDVSGTFGVRGTASFSSNTILNGALTLNTTTIALGASAGIGQGSNSVAIGTLAANTSQGYESVAIGNLAGQISQSYCNVAIGIGAGYNTQGQGAVAVGQAPGYTNQQPGAVAIGSYAGFNTQGACAIAIGSGAAASGSTSQGSNAVAIGNAAAYTEQGVNSVAIGLNAGSDTQGQNGVAIGNGAGQYTQGSNSGYTGVAIGYLAGNYYQNQTAVAIGYNTAVSNQGLRAIAVGDSAGYDTQGSDSIAIGTIAGTFSQVFNAIAVGYAAGQSNQQGYAVAIGTAAGNISQGYTSIAIGINAGYTNQAAYAVALGNSAGYSNQASGGTAVGVEAGSSNQVGGATAIGNQAGLTGQLEAAVAVGVRAGRTDQGQYATAIGPYSGYSNQGSNAIAIGNSAGYTSQSSNSIILNATGSALNTSVSGFIVAPVRSVTTASGNILCYTANNEVIQAGLATLGQASVTTNLPTTNGLALNSNSYYFDDGNSHIHSKSGSIWINPLDSSSVLIGTQSNSGSGGGLTVQANITTNTTGVGHSFFYKKQSGVNVTFGTETSMDNLNCRINSAGGSAGQLQASALSGSFSAYVSCMVNVAGQPPIMDTNSSGITFTSGTWSSIGASRNMGAGGDMIIAHVHDNTNSRIYRVTAIHGSGTTGGYVAIERMG